MKQKEEAKWKYLYRLGELCWHEGKKKKNGRIFFLLCYTRFPRRVFLSSCILRTAHSSSRVYYLRIDIVD